MIFDERGYLAFPKSGGASLRYLNSRLYETADLSVSISELFPAKNAFKAAKKSPNKPQ
jgi:hypothetical protein